MLEVGFLGLSLCPLNITFLIWIGKLLSWLTASLEASMNEGVGEGRVKATYGRGREGERQVGEGAWVGGGGGGTSRDLQGSVMVQGAEGQLGTNCSRCRQVAC